MIEILATSIRNWIWYGLLPSSIRTVVKRLPPTTCLIDVEGDGHYWVVSYEEYDSRVQLQVDHGADSFLPGFRVLNCEPEDLRVCGCGKWQRVPGIEFDDVENVMRMDGWWRADS